ACGHYPERPFTSGGDAATDCVSRVGTHFRDSERRMKQKPHRREISVALAIAALAMVLAIAAPDYFARENLSDLFLANIPVLVVALGMTLVILVGQIDISVGSTFAICSVAAGMLAKSGLPVLTVMGAACLLGGAIGSINGAFVAYVRIPSIVVT